MRKIKTWYTALLGVMLALIAMLTLSCVSLVSARAAEPEDVTVSVGTQGLSALNVYEDTDLNGEKVTAYGCDGWGNILTLLNLDKSYDLQAIADSQKGALTFWINFCTASSLEAYKSMTGTFIIDVSSGAEYSDAHKYSFQMSALFADCELGWNQILLPFATAAEKNDMDWSNVTSIRINGNNSGFTAAASDMRFAAFTFTTTEEETMQVVKEEVNLPADVVLNITSSELTTGTDTVDGQEMTVYSCTGWGNVLAYLRMDEAQNASEIFATGKGALSFWMCFRDEAALNAYKNATGSFNVDVSSGAEYSDSHKYSFQISTLFADCEVGWNEILLPLAAAAEKNDMDWSDIRNIRLNGTGSGVADGVSNLSFAAFKVTTTEEESMQVVKEEAPLPDDVALVIASSSNLTASSETVNGETVTAYGCSGWGNVLSFLYLDKAYDASEIFATNKGALTFWMYFENETSLAAYQEMEGDFLIDVSSQQDYTDGDAHKYAFEISALFDHCKVGWNQLLLPLATAGEKTAIDWSGVWCIRVNGSNSALETGVSNLKFASFAFTVTDEVRMTVLTDLDNIALTVVNCQDMDETTETIGDMQVTAYGCVDFGWGPFVKVLTLDRDYDVSTIAATEKGAFTFWMYIADDATLAAYKAVEDFWTVDVCSSINYNDTNKYAFMMASVFDDCIVGWNKVVLPFATAQEKNDINWTKVRTLRLNCDGTSLPAGSNNVKFAEFGFTVTDETEMCITQTIAAQTGGGGEEEDLDPIDEMIIIDCNSVSGTVFTGNKVDKEDFRYGTGCVYTSGAGYGLTATDLEVGKTDLRKNSIVLAMWVWIEDISFFSAQGVNGQIELSSSNAYDKNEIFWESWWSGLNSGWNWLVLRGEDASVSGGLPDFDNLKRVRLYVNGIANSTLKIDRITIGNVDNAALFTEPDWENEKADSGVFKGANSYVAENGTYIEVDFSEAEGFTAVERMEVPVSVPDTAATVCVIVFPVLGVLCAAVVVVLLLKKKRKS